MDLAEKGRILCSDGRVATAIAASLSDLDEREEVGRERGALLSLILGIWIETLRLFSGEARIRVNQILGVTKSTCLF